MITYANKVFTTKGADGQPNGRIIRVWERESADDPWPRNSWDDRLPPGQVYITTILPGCVKGPHLHMRRDSLFCCVRGEVRITTRRVETGEGQSGAFQEYRYETAISGGLPGTQALAVHVPAGTPCELYGLGMDEALVVNVSSEPYDPTDEHEVPDWRPPSEA